MSAVGCARVVCTSIDLNFWTTFTFLALPHHRIAYVHIGISRWTKKKKYHRSPRIIRHKSHALQTAKQIWSFRSALASFPCLKSFIIQRVRLTSRSVFTPDYKTMAVPGSGHRSSSCSGQRTIPETVSTTRVTCEINKCARRQRN